MIETEALLAKEPSGTIAGKTYTLHKLLLTEAMPPLARVLLIAQERTGVTITEIVSLSSDPDKVGKLFLAALGWAHVEVFLLLEQLLGVTQKELQVLPLSAVNEFIPLLVQQVDLQRFLLGRTAAISPETTPETLPTPEPSDDSASRSNAEPAGQMMSSEASASLAG